ncbi:protein of unknown function [Limnospira indica PCC 8005]|uniref:Uncharacterized protein n=1 Tax=Limnospira indica PCC 8005 TaxID=376219 RepID=A0A9P1KIT9_9CYAN|nr:protein of unknown function [Limnospira indica PCC 8005]
MLQSFEEIKCPSKLLLQSSIGSLQFFLKTRFKNLWWQPETNKLVIFI